MALASLSKLLRILATLLTLAALACTRPAPPEPHVEKPDAAVAPASQPATAPARKALALETLGLTLEVPLTWVSEDGLRARKA